MNQFLSYLKKKQIALVFCAFCAMFSVQQMKAVESVSAYSGYLNYLSITVHYDANCYRGQVGNQKTTIEVMVTSNGKSQLFSKTVQDEDGGFTTIYTGLIDWFVPGTSYFVEAKITYHDYWGGSWLNYVSPNKPTCRGTFKNIEVEITNVSQAKYARKIDVDWRINNQVAGLQDYRISTGGIITFYVYDQYTGQLKGTVPYVEGTTEYSFQDTGLEPGVTKDYEVRAVYHSILSGLTQSQPASSRYYIYKLRNYIHIGSTFDINFTATRDRLNVVKLRWNAATSTDATKYIIQRIESSDATEVDNITNISYSSAEDYPPVAGYNYTYRIITEGSDVVATAIGRTYPDGHIQGKVLTSIHKGVSNVVVIAERQGTVPSDTTSFYRDTTDMEGCYDISGVFYNEESTFDVYPILAGHEFDPLSKEATVSGSAKIKENIDFTDISAFTVSGNISQQTGDVLLGVEGVEILVNNMRQGRGVFTNSDGDYFLAIPQADDYTITPQRENHLFSPDSISLYVGDNLDSQNFMDTTVFTLDGKFCASCNIFIGEADLLFSTLNGKFDTIVTTHPENGTYTLDLPARKYQVQMIAFEPIVDFSISSDELLSYFKVDTIDLCFNDTSMNFIFRLPPTLTVEADGYSESCDQIIMQQGKPYDVVFTVTENFKGTGCNTDIGYVVVNEMISSDDFIKDTLTLSNGVAIKTIVPGEPKVTGDNYLKELIATAYVGENSVSETLKILVTGNRPRGETFTTVSPSIPLLILHDPPGDASYSYMEENTTIENTMSFSVEEGGSVNTWLDVKLGAEFEAGQFVFTKSKIWGNVKGSVEVGGRVAENNEYSYSISNTEAFSTSGNDNIIGSSGDVYVGAALNLIYALTDIIVYDYDHCKPVKSTKMIVAPNGFNTTYMYTEDHILNVLLPQLDEMREYALAAGDARKVREYETQKKVWNQVIAYNKENIKKAKFIENKSFSPGLSYESSIETASSSSMTLDFGLFVNEQLAIQAGFEFGGSGISGGVEINFRADFGHSETNTEIKTHRTGYVLEDDDPGDFFSVDICTDQVYGTPAFRTKAGRSSCPWEQTTQQREKLQLYSNVYTQEVASEFDEAVFRLEMANLSGSNEEQTYNLMFDPTSNPDGAIISIGGSSVFGNIPTPYTISPFGTAYATVTVKKGPLVSSYSDLKFTLESSCDGSVSDDVYLNVKFPTLCSNMDIATEADVVTTDSFVLKTSGYDKTHMEMLEVQYCKKNASYWAPLLVMDVESFVNDDIDIQITNILDGEYKIRTKISYKEDENYSNSIDLLVDRESPVLEGLPLPLTVLTLGDRISVSFNEAIACGQINQSNLSFTNISKNDANLDFEYGSYDKTIVIRSDFNGVDNDDYLRMQVQGISDMYGNTSDDTIIWEFTIADVDAVLNDPDADTDGDKVINANDNCILMYNPEQGDIDENGIGDVCDGDMDGDGVSNEVDNCPMVANADQADANNNGIGDVCENATAINIQKYELIDVVTYPNPFTDNITFEINVMKATKGRLEIFDVTGKSVNISKELKLNTGRNEIIVDTQALNSGVFIYKLSFKDNAIIDKLVK